jgi:hypothetical protein
MNRYLIITPQCAYFVSAVDIASAALLASIWNSCRIIKWMVQNEEMSS